MLNQGFYNALAITGIMAAIFVIYKLVLTAVYYKRQERAIIRLAKEIKEREDKEDA